MQSVVARALQQTHAKADNPRVVAVVDKPARVLRVKIQIPHHRYACRNRRPQRKNQRYSVCGPLRGDGSPVSARVVAHAAQIPPHYSVQVKVHSRDMRRHFRNNRMINRRECHAVRNLARCAQSHRYCLHFAFKAAQSHNKRFRRPGQTQSRQAKHRRGNFPQHRAVTRSRSRRSQSRLAPHRHRLVCRQQHRLHKRPRRHRVAGAVIGGHKYRALYGLKITACNINRNIRRRHRQCRRRIVLPRIRHRHRAQAPQSHKRLPARNRRKQRRVCHRFNFQCINRRQRINIVLNRHRPLQQSLQRSRHHRARLHRHRHRHRNFRTVCKRHRHAAVGDRESRREHRAVYCVREYRCQTEYAPVLSLRAAGVDVQRECVNAARGKCRTADIRRV